MSFIVRKSVLAVSNQFRLETGCAATEATVKFLKKLDARNFAVNYLKFKQICKTLWYFVKMVHRE